MTPPRNPNRRPRADRGAGSNVVPQLRKRWPPEEKERLSEAQNHRCAFCGTRMGATGQYRDYPTIEHVIPLSRGGADDESNVVIACRGCNDDRGAGVTAP